MDGSLCIRTAGQGARSAHGHGVCTGYLSQTVPVGLEKFQMPMMAIVHCQHSSAPFFCKLLCNVHLKLGFAIGCSGLLLNSRETGLAVRDS